MPTQRCKTTGVATLSLRNAGSLNILFSPVLTDLARGFSDPG